jgi:hypothetical protein
MRIVVLVALIALSSARADGVTVRLVGETVAGTLSLPGLTLSDLAQLPELGLCTGFVSPEICFSYELATLGSYSLTLQDGRTFEESAVPVTVIEDFLQEGRIAFPERTFQFNNGAIYQHIRSCLDAGEAGTTDGCQLASVLFFPGDTQPREFHKIAVVPEPTGSLVFGVGLTLLRRSKHRLPRRRRD